MILDKKQLPLIKVSERTDIDPITKIKHVVETVDLSDFDSALLAYVADRAVHRFTIGIEAPWPPYEILRPIAEAIERGEPFITEHADQFNHDWDTALAMNKSATLADVVQADPPSLWARIVEAFNVLTGKVSP